MIELNRIYKANDAFHDDYNPENFRWVDCHQEERCIYAVERKGEINTFVGRFNFSDEEQKEYQFVKEPEETCSVVMNTDWEEYGGATKKQNTESWLKSEKETVTVNLPPYSGILLRII